jgi:hypothetical protein
MLVAFGRLAWRLLASLAMLAALAAVSIGWSEPSLDEEALRNMEVHSVWAGKDPVRLVDGEYRGAIEPESGSADAAEIAVRLTEPMAFGELDGQQAAGAVLVTNPGPSGILYSFLAVVVEQEGEPLNVASAFLGPWVQVDSIAIEGEEIVLDTVIHGPEDPLCCPTQRVVQTYALHGDTLAMGSKNE